MKISKNLKSRLPKGKRGRVKKQASKAYAHEGWQFPAKLENEKVVLQSILPLYTIDFYKEIVGDVRSLITKLVQNHGFNDGSARYNVIKNYTISLIEYRNPDNPGWLATSKVYKVPSQLGENFIKLIVDYLNCTDEVLLPKYYQVINTTLNIVRIVEGYVSPDFQSVTDKASKIDDKLLNDFSTYVEKELSSFKYTKPPVNLWEYRFRLTKNGPNGVPKIESAVKEAILLLNSKMKNSFQRICDEMGCNYLLDYLSALVSNQAASNLEDTTAGTTYLRKLVKVPDSGFKTRIVAIVDFWTQLIMLPIRQHVQFVTKTKFGNTDFRLNQDRGVKAMVEFQNRCLRKEQVGSKTLDIKYLRFYDISSWTDRFHRDLQKIVMAKLFTPRLTEAWAQLVVHCDWYSPDLKRNIKYGQGQGMGTNGSFDIATLTDHLFINFIYDEVSQYKGIFPNNECYGKVGDDLWIYDPEDLIIDYYGRINLPINLSKSKTFSRNSFGEFCARTFRDGIDVSRISPNIINRSRDFRYMPTLLAICASRGIQLDSSSFESLNRKVKNSEETYLDKLQDWIISMLLIGNYEQGSYFDSLTLEYLEAGNWLTENSRLREFLGDPMLAKRLMICHSVDRIAKAKEAIKDKIFENVFAMEEFGDEIVALSSKGVNLFDITSVEYGIALNAFPKQSVILPRQIIIFGRYADQRRLVQDRLFEVEMESAYQEDSLMTFSRNLQEIASLSCYDDGNINYNHKRVYNTQYSIIEILKRGNEDLTVFTLKDSNELRTILQELHYGRFDEEYFGLLPTFNVEA